MEGRATTVGDEDDEDDDTVEEGLFARILLTLDCDKGLYFKFLLIISSL